MVVWWLLSLFYLFCQNPISMVLAIAAGVLLFIAVKFGSMKNQGGQNKSSYFESENRKARYNSGRNDGKFY